MRPWERAMLFAIGLLGIWGGASLVVAAVSNSDLFGFLWLGMWSTAATLALIGFVIGPKRG